MATPRASEDIDAEVRVTAEEGRGTKHALRPAEGQGTSMHPEERQRVTVDDGRASEDTDMEVGIMECSNMREHGKRRNGGKRVMGSSKDQSTHSKGDVGERGEPTGGEHEAGRVGTPRYAARGRRNPACDRKGRERVRMVNKADKGRMTGSATVFRKGRTGRKMRAPNMADRMEPTVRQKSLGVVDRVVPMLREHAAGMADREASVVRLERVVFLEMENEVEHADEDAEDPGNAGSRKEDQGQPDSGSEESGNNGRNGRRPA
jgi:hypothetical protein